MISEERIRLMTKMEILRQKEDRKAFEVTRNRKGDFIWIKLWKSGLLYTFGFAFFLGVFLVWRFSRPEAVNTTHIGYYGGICLIIYVAGLVLVCLGSWVAAEQEYSNALTVQKKYETMLKRLKWIYQKEEKP